MFHFQALDRPDRLQIQLGGRTSEPPLAGKPGRQVGLRHFGRPCFRGTTDSVSGGFDAARGSWLRLVAYPAYQARRALTRSRFHQLSDSELAQQLAIALQLVPVVDPTTHVHRAIDVEGDALAMLRRHADGCGYELAVADSKLFFVRSLPRCAGVVAVDGRADGAEREWHHGSDSPTRGRMRVEGDAGWRPLQEFRLCGVPAGNENVWRVVRALHFLDPSGYQTHLEFVAVQ